MRSEQEIRDSLRSWVLAKAADRDGATITDQTALFEERYLRSVHLPELLLLLERLSGTPIDVEDLNPGDFRDIDSMVLRFCTTGATP
ncbi:acyl carrier protein [Streptomyces sp. RPT161]|uniref:acyl carrier protein n=1 Tax=Streptomyces sp. RPT161 TaxID=3015993 RepID=UPI0022B93008|nr:acyl carrier protein [Streptomyces sp. RPT161]